MSKKKIVRMDDASTSLAKELENAKGNWLFSKLDNLPKDIRTAVAAAMLLETTAAVAPAFSADKNPAGIANTWSYSKITDWISIEKWEKIEWTELYRVSSGKKEEVFDNWRWLISVGATYSSTVGTLGQAMIAHMMWQKAAFSIMIEAWSKQAKYLATFWYEITKNQRVKVSAERLDTLVKMTFDSWEESARMWQNAFWAEYEYTLPKGFIDSMAVKAIYVSAESRDFGPKEYVVDTTTLYELYKNDRRIAWWTKIWWDFTLTATPWNNWKVKLTWSYESTTFDKKYDTTSSDTSRFWGKFELSQKFLKDMEAKAFVSTDSTTKYIAWWEIDYNISNWTKVYINWQYRENRDWIWWDNKSEYRVWGWLNWSFDNDKLIKQSAASFEKAKKANWDKSETAKPNKKEPEWMVSYVKTPVVNENWYIWVKDQKTKRLVAIDKTALPAWANIDKATWNVLVDLVPSLWISSITKDWAAFTNNGNFDISGWKLVINTKSLQEPTPGSTNTYVITVDEVWWWQSIINLVVEHWSVKIKWLTITRIAALVAPTITDLWIVGTNKPTWTWTASAWATSYQISIDWWAYTDIWNVLTYTSPTALTEWIHTLSIKSVRWTNVSTNANTSTVIVDSIPPVAITVTWVANSTVYSTTVTPTWTDAAGTTSTATLNGAAYTKGTAISADWAYALVVTTTKTTNGKTAQTTINFTIDALAPAAPIVSGITNWGSYVGTVTPSVTAVAWVNMTATLNWNPYTIGSAITNIWANTLVFTATKTANWKTSTTTVNFNVVAADTTPDQFTFTDEVWVALSALKTSAPITVSWINSASPISIVGWTYSINGWVFTSTAWTVNNWDQVRVQHTASALNSTATHTDLTIWWIADRYTTMTVAPTDSATTLAQPVFGSKTWNSVTISNSSLSFADVDWIQNTSIVIATDSGFSNIIGSLPGLTWGTFAWLNWNITYYFRIQWEAFNKNLWTWESKVTPALAVVTSNIDSASSVSAPSVWSITTTWATVTNNISDADWIQNINYYIYSDAGGTNLVATNATWTFTWLTAGTTYYAKTSLQAKDLNTNTWVSYTSGLTNFNTLNADATTNLSAPTVTWFTNRTITISDATSKFTDTDWVQSTIIQIATDSGFTNVVSTLPITWWTANVPTWWTTYYVRVSWQAKNGTTLAWENKVTSAATVTTSADITTPAGFTFSDVTAADLNIDYISNAITVSGINAPSTISIAWGTYSINGWAYTSSTWTVNNWDTVTVKHTSSASYSTAVNTTLNIGWVTDIYTTSTKNPPNSPTTLSAPVFGSKTDTSITISNSAASFADTDWIQNTQIEIATDSGFTNIIWTIPWLTGGSFSWLNQSTTYYLRISWQAYNANTLAWENKVTPTLTVTTNVTPDTIPNAFSFTSTTWANTSTLYTSASITVWWINTASPISVTGWYYSINGWATTNTAWTVNNGDVVTVTVLSSWSFSTTTNATLTIGWVSGTYSVTTSADNIAPNTPSISINSWNQYTSSTSVSIAVTWDTDNVWVTWWYVSESSSTPTSWAAWWVWTRPTTATISSWDWVKTLYVWTKDAVWNVSASGSAAVTLDTIIPNSPVWTAWVTTRNTQYYSRQATFTTGPSWIDINGLSIVNTWWWTITNISVSWSTITFDYLTPNTGWESINIIWTSKSWVAFDEWIFTPWLWI